MDPPSPIRRDLAQEEIRADMICDTPVGDPPESPSSYLNPSGDGMEVERNEDEAGGSDDGEADGTLTKSGGVDIWSSAISRCITWVVYI